ncbi:enolase-phosphatase E-1 [Isoalcanivorax pacificus W11-5]|uniref:Enolase-phosphatase E-1 n=1 Tax=Isoalcanivorax pacificus W11-5 TaxID=391936 RepID=A0A0B4XMJ5_9GAMM|nr:enolase-phosphatase E-1 [Isoalcanivorax pacificus W11-5]
MIKAILTDIEGTTSSISFVKDVLFPYAARALPGFLHEHWASAAVQEQVHALRAQTGDALPDAEAVNALLQEWIQQDRKDTPLKAHRGLSGARAMSAGTIRRTCTRRWLPGYAPGVTRVCACLSILRDRLPPRSCFSATVTLAT